MPLCWDRRKSSCRASKSRKKKLAAQSPQLTMKLSSRPHPYQPKNQKTFASGIIKIQPDGVIKNIWNMEQDQVQSIFIDADNSLLVGASNNGRLFKILPNDEKTYLHKFDESQVVTFVPGKPGATWIATSNFGKIYSMESRFAQAGEYKSEVIDAQMNTQWGMISWEQNLQSGNMIKLLSRSGNTQKPNSTWSPWSAPYQKKCRRVYHQPKSQIPPVETRIHHESLSRESHGEKSQNIVSAAESAARDFFNQC